VTSRQPKSRRAEVRQSKLLQTEVRKAELRQPRVQQPRLQQPRLYQPELRQPSFYESVLRKPSLHTQLGRAAVRIFSANERMNQMVIEHLDTDAWKAKPPNNVRTIGAIFTHMHNMRCKWIRLTAPHLKIPTQLNRAHCTPQQVRAGLAESAARCAEMLAEAFDDSKGARRVEKFQRDGWARPWPVGPEMLCYMVAHEAHHRGQVCMLAHQLGFPLPVAVMAGIWNWEKLWKECGSPAGPGEDS
jgi:uncharacterized damage-inducible protein DinB